jgi:ABC-type nitrate/sulfonate/bicarbonate transport system substrate-binding protein
MKNSSRLLGIFIVAILALSWTAGDAAAQVAGKPVTIKYAQAFPIPDYLPLYVARDKEYFRQENLTVEILTLPTGDKQITALLAGSIEICSYTPDWIIRAIEKGEARIKIVMGGGALPVYSLVVPKEVTSYADLRGKRIAVSALKGSDVHFMRKMAAANGLREADYILIQAGSSADRAAALKAGSVSAALLIPPLDQKVIDEGYRRLDVSSNVVKQYEWITHTIRQDWANANRAALVAFMRAWIKGTRWVYDPRNKEETIRILAREMKLEDRYARKAYEMYFEAKTWGVDGKLDLAGLQAVVDAIAEQGDLAPPIPKADKYVDLSYWQEALKTLR